MKQFSDLLGTESLIQISITLESVIENGAPHVRVTCNDKALIDDPLIESLTWRHQVDLLDPIDIGIQLSGKKYSAVRETAVIIKSIMIDRFEVIPKWTHLATYQNERHNTDATSYLGFNGVWRFKIHEPFYRWQHRITGQGWLLEPITTPHDLVPSSTSTRDSLAHSDTGSIAVDKDPTKVG